MGCIGPNDDGSAVTVAQCRALYPTRCDDSADIEIFTALDASGVVTDFPYQAYCPCFDASGQGVQGQGLNVGNVAATRGWKRRTVSSTGVWSDASTGTFANRNWAGGISIVDLATDASSSCTGTWSS